MSVRNDLIDEKNVESQKRPKGRSKKIDRYDAVILGGGLTGLSLAYKLLETGNLVCLVEKEEALGGLARSYVVDETIFDFGPHVLRSADHTLVQWARSLVQMRSYRTKADVFKYGKVFDGVIPTITRKNIELLPERSKKRILKELKETSASPRNRDTNFRDAVEAQIGATLYNEFFGEYSTKWWGVPPAKLSVILAPKNLRVDNNAEYAHITTDFSVPKEEYYPKEGGYGSIAGALEERIRRRHCTILSGSNVTGLEIDGDRIHNIVLEGGQEIKEPRGTVYSTIPITILCELLGIRTNLRYRSDICIYVVSKLTGNVRRVPNSWLYFPENNKIFSRLSDISNFSSCNSPTGSIGLCAEVTCFPEDPIWRDKHLPEKLIEQLADLGFLDVEAVIGWHVIKEPHAYPLLTCGYAKELATVRNRIEERISNIVLAGRTGSFTYCNSDIALAYCFET